MVAGVLEALEHNSLKRSSSEVERLAKEAALLQAVTRDIKMATSRGQLRPLLLGHRKRRWARR
jgi:hypothetical protein